MFQEFILGKNSKLASGILGILLAILAWVVVPGDVHPKAPLATAMVVIMAVWWVFEVIPIPVTSLFPLILMPLFDIADLRETGTYYGRPIIFLFLGGFLMAFGLQESGLHKRIALKIVRLLGSRTTTLILGFMVATGALSMWISNTAAVMVMLPIGLSLMNEIGSHVEDRSIISLFGVSLFLGIAYSADIGGMATPIGTPPNLVFMELYETYFPTEEKVGFLQWMIIGLPLSIVFMTLGWILLCKVIFKLPPLNIFEGKIVIDRHLSSLGKASRDEWVSGILFAAAALLWITGSDLHLGDQWTIHGWRSTFNLENITDPVIAIAAGCVLFMIPSSNNKGKALLNWERARDIPWGILLLFGGGFAIAGAFETSGLSQIVGLIFTNIEVGSPGLLVLLINTVLTFLTEVTSNTATTNLVLPILAKGAMVLDLDPRYLMIPATLSASCAFMMPVASPTQAIVFGSGYVNIRQMVKAGIWFNILGILLVTAIFLLLGPIIFNL